MYYSSDESKIISLELQEAAIVFSSSSLTHSFNCAMEVNLMERKCIHNDHGNSSSCSTFYIKSRMLVSQEKVGLWWKTFQIKYIGCTHFIKIYAKSKSSIFTAIKIKFTCHVTVEKRYRMCNTEMKYLFCIYLKCAEYAIWEIKLCIKS